MYKRQWVSTGKAGYPNPWDITTLAVLWPTPGSFSNSSNEFGTLPLCLSIIISDNSWIAFDLEGDKPIFGICLGFQLMCLASEAKTYKMKFGHHGANHPVIDVETRKVSITSQNHGFTINEESLNDNVIVTHRSLFDKSIQGISSKDGRFFSFQGHPEASPGPKDIQNLFDKFINNMQFKKKAN